ncbi:ADP-ribosylglycohydrolase family protein [Streptomyces sp. TLI_105]|uniref:ADP-ribosylglycohydrolase family protein n=1 Tax=Streptomyces sp. TLI_105 TaxID=1881019 RepID=UPI0008965C99|nr:ADP-ribosylglycohydrolase family protein [Streptomyces sp. TLI_105]SED59459.1 ADP-ribosylglycohydrolase [Streptomyces sp. TLI_105]
MTLRLTWVQPEDLVGHELRQAAEDGRDASGLAARWKAAGGPPAPETAGASPVPRPDLRPLAEDLLDTLATLPSPLSTEEPTTLPEIQASAVPAPAPISARAGAAGAHPRVGNRPAGAGGVGTRDGAPCRAQASAPEPAPVRAAPSWGGAHPPPSSRLRSNRGDPPRPAERLPTSRPGEGEGEGAGPQPGRAAGRLARPKPGSTPLRNRLHAAWLGRAVGCLLGKPVEKLPLPAIRALARAAGNWPLTTWFTARGVPAELLAAHPWNRRSAATSLAENIDGMPEDDDLNYPLLNLLLLQRYGRDFTTADVARLWLDELPAGRTFTAERVAYRNLLDGVEPPLTAVRRNPFREWIGAQIRADVHGWTHPGDPAAAAAQAHRDAVLTHTANGVYGAMFVAAALATAATGTADVHQALAAGLGVIPPRSRLAGAVRLGIETARAHPRADEFDTVVDRLHAELGGYHWVHAVPNSALLAAALTHADGDFSRSVCAAVSGGWDTDSNGATAGSLAGLLAGHPDRLPERWTSPLKNRLATSVPSFDGIGFDTLAELTHLEAVRP